MTSVKTECNKPLNGLCKKLLIGSLMAFSLIAYTGCSTMDSGHGSKCGGDKKCAASGKCGKSQKTSKCGEEKCSSSKCGGDKKCGSK